ncbi:AbrB family transcriptional regulator [Vallitalea longa]|uniref:AbrB family transcriptional regulator n=1 Tax=Vallitalea longa TaxID=2936439 RepID=A0A9W6DEG1_9FIRM|nr:AbrB/MazE/SpoVT family DNA-binding domain-containing protein [Vallitalea longa]GKX28412.1 AbrB family transcriptional regulator [Vallitalea longa]
MGTENKSPNDGKYMSSVKVGTKGQIVIPKEARDMFNIKPGDTLLLLADVDRGIAINRLDFFDKMADGIFSGKVKPAEGEDKSQLDRFAKEVKDVQKQKGEEN